MLKALMFDMDGVLVNSMPYHVEAMKVAFDNIGVQINKQDIYEHEGSRTIDIVRDLLIKDNKNPDSFNLDGIIQQYEQEFNKIVKLEPFEGLKDLLDALKNKYILCVVSGAEDSIVKDILEKLYPDVFDVIITANDVENGKPVPEPYLRAVEKSGVEKGECIVFENAMLGVESAKRAGLYCVAIPTYIDRNKLENADVIVENHDCLKQYLIDLE
ncbi:HAD-superfamily hydrolase, subfamily IA, variant 3 [Methanohalobium evestigatum Z-7303]|uniref:HAD-superfamily hydrolase, subfamily IA, variant 3 n=1 Tax=Methanohalobium evestigatum (strain ATCC BAA-1072 / DSM 3721 / NBRC 107634 / OCM 161 / Z-7303) TaxID=644295 RepID=D7E8A8_METEZ|nr:HAD family phosphatase [Methanohalobium evestigatum]ADI73450.1 HAD-superfamily hydrolase, subfamily IA, variant 3 [Methanohalobium evestigatum Z-7303]